MTCPRCGGRHEAGGWYDPAVEFEERIKKAVEDGFAHIEAERRADTEFRDGWERARTVVWRAFGEAAEAIREAQLGQAGPANYNGSTRLIVKRTTRETEREFRLEFNPDYKARLVVCRSSLKNRMQEETFTLDGIEPEAVKEKCVAFVQAIMDDLADRH